MSSWTTRTVAIALGALALWPAAGAAQTPAMPETPPAQSPTAERAGAPGSHEGRAREQARSARAAAGAGRRDQALRREARHALGSRPGHREDPPLAAGELAHRRTAALLHRGSPAGGLPGARRATRLGRAQLAADPGAASARTARPDGCSTRCSRARCTSSARRLSIDRRKLRATLFKEGKQIWTLARRDRQVRHADAARPVLDPRAPEGHAAASTGRGRSGRARTRTSPTGPAAASSASTARTSPA